MGGVGPPTTPYDVVYDISYMLYDICYYVELSYCGWSAAPIALGGRCTPSNASHHPTIARTVSGRDASSFMADLYRNMATDVSGESSSEYHQWAGIAMAYPGPTTVSWVSICASNSSFTIFPELSQKDRCDIFSANDALRHIREVYFPEHSRTFTDPAVHIR